MQMSKESYLGFVQQLAGEMKDARVKSVVDRRKVAECDGKIEQLNLKVQLLADDLQKVVSLRAQQTARDVELTAMHVAASRSNNT